MSDGAEDAKAKRPDLPSFEVGVLGGLVFRIADRITHGFKRVLQTSHTRTPVMVGDHMM
jgi:hypothetical protein